MRLRIILNSHRVVFVAGLLLTWLCLALWVHFFYASKFNHYDATYQAFMARSRKLQESSQQAHTQLVELMERTASIGHKNNVLFNESSRFLCVAVLSKNRINSNVNYVNQAVMSLLTRVDIKEPKLTFILFNTEENPDNNKHALELSKLIHIESLSSNVIHPNNVRVKEAADYALVS